MDLECADISIRQYLNQTSVIELPAQGQDAGIDDAGSGHRCGDADFVDGNGQAAGQPDRLDVSTSPKAAELGAADRVADKPMAQ